MRIAAMVPPDIRIRQFTSDLLDRVDNLKQQLHEACAVAADALETRTGGPAEWLVQLAGRREELLVALRPTFAARCDECSGFRADEHDSWCTVGAFLRIVGGPEETQRQVDAAHGAAIQLVRVRSDDGAISYARLVTTHPHYSAVITDINYGANTPSGDDE